MRPVSLHLDGFAVFRAPTDLDFDGLDYFALVGPTGAGKSTVIDAICFALYGSVPRYGDDRVVGRVVSLGKTQATVSLTFDVGESRYLATRVVRVRDGKVKTEAVLERVVAEGPSEVLAQSAREMRPAVEALLGLPFAHFTKCVVLPQGDFARFLHDEPSKRQDLLARLLDLDVYTRIGQRARRLADELANEVELQTRQLAELEFATTERRDAADARLTSLRALLRTVDEAIPADDASADAWRQLEAERAERAELATRAAAVAVPAAVTDAAATIAGARDALETARTTANQAQEAARAASEQVDALPDAAPLRAARQAYDGIAGLERDVAAAVVTADVSADAWQRIIAAVSTADAAGRAARADLDGLREAHAAHTLLATLDVGAPCPVCAQVVEKKPRAKKLGALDAAESALADAERFAAEARALERTTTQEKERTAAALESLRVRRAELERVVAEHPDIAAIETALAGIDTLTASAAEARQADSAARQAESTARDALARAERGLAEHRSAFHRQRDPLAALDPPALGDDLASDWDDLATWAREQQVVLAARIEELTALAAEALHRRRAAVGALVGLASDCGLAVDTTELGPLRDAVMQAGHDARTEFDRITDALERAEKLRTAMTTMTDEHRVARLLAQQLRADRFEKWLVGEALERLVEGASVTLRELTNDAYSLACEDGGEFVVIDHHNADERRSARTLSGGETFQASLALALALADQLTDLAAGGAAKLEAIFLDEGFGTLDAETLESVAETIETLGSRGRMVGLVTHVPALAERVPVRFRIRPGDQGATVVREEL